MPQPDDSGRLASSTPPANTAEPEPGGEGFKQPASDLNLAETAGVVLGRALLDSENRVWLQLEGTDDWWTLGNQYGRWTRAAIQAEGPVRDAVLVSPEAGRVLEALQRWAAVWGRIGGPDSRDWLIVCQQLASAWYAMVGDRPAQPAPGERDEALREDADVGATNQDDDGPPDVRLPRHTAACGCDPALSSVAADLAEPAPEPDSGTGWTRCGIDHLIGMIHAYARIEPGEMPVTVNDAVEVTALLADRDRLSIDVQQAQDRTALAETAVSESERLVETAYRSMVDAQMQRDAARAELATARRATAVRQPSDKLAVAEARRWGIVDTLEFVARLDDRSFTRLTTLAAEVLAGTRTIPGQPEPATSEEANDG